ncbi:carboxypeptidase-like regulatory domain-containing protein [Marinilabilia sp.]
MRPTHNSYLLFLFLIGFTLLSGCEDKIESSLSGTLTGRILDQENLMPLEEIRVSTNPYSEIVETDSMGRFTINDIKTGEYNVIASKSGYKSESVTVTVFFNETTDVELVLTESVDSSEELVFTDSFLPAAGESVSGLELLFAWGIEGADSVSFDLLLFQSGNDLSPIVFEDIKDTTYLVQGLKYNTNYLWQIVGYHNSREYYSSVRRFNTSSFPNNQILFAGYDKEILQLFVCDSLAENTSQITFSKHHSWNAKINDQRTAIAFQSTRDVETGLYAMDTDGGNIRRLTDFHVGGYFHEKIEYDWAPDGTHIIFSSYENLYSINKDGTGLRVVTRAPAGYHFREVVYSPDGENIYAIVLSSDVLDRKIYQMDENGDNMSLLYEDSGYALANLDVSPDLRSLLFSKDLSGHVSTTGRMLNAHVFELNIGNGTEVDLSVHKPAGTNDLNASYSPDGGSIVFTNGRNTLSSVPNIYVMQIDGKKRKTLIHGGYTPQWFE